jgi:tetratricopeptide (TPR) repeat protein
MATYNWNKRLPWAQVNAINYFKQAIARDPTFAPAYAGLADCYILAEQFGSRPHEAYELAKEWAQKALNLDSQLAEAHASLGFALLHGDWDWQKAKSEFLLAISLKPNYSIAHVYYARYLTLLSRFEEAFAEIRRAREIDPHSPLVNWLEGLAYYWAGHFDEAIAAERKAIDLEPNAYYAHQMVGWSCMWKNAFDDGIREFQEAVRLSGDEPYHIACLGAAYGLAGKRSEALRLLERLKELAKKKYIPSHAFVIVYVGLNDQERALEYLQKGYDDRDIYMSIKVDPIFKTLRTNPRFQEIVRKMNFPK